jgi:D-tyrosyl-tRNA(Tyr) deacylase
MKALIQRVSNARVDVEGKVISEIGKGMLVFFSVIKDDTAKDLDYIVKKLSNLRIFEDSDRKINLSIQDIKGEILVVSEFTLSADCRKGNRPSFDKAEEPSQAEKMYLELIKRLRDNNIKVASGDFGAFMQVHLVNDGPVTIMLDSKP